LQQQRHPGLAKAPIIAPVPTAQVDVLGLERNEADPAADKRAMDQARVDELLTTIWGKC